MWLETELQEKDMHIYRITVQYNEVENELQRSKQELFHQVQTAEHYIQEVNTSVLYSNKDSKGEII